MFSLVRGRAVPVVATASSMLVATAALGAVLLTAGVDHPRPTASPQSSAQSLPLRVPLPTATMQARPGYRAAQAATAAKAARPSARPTGRPTAGPSGAPAAASKPAAAAHRPSAAQRDAELAAFVSSLGGSTEPLTPTTGPTPAAVPAPAVPGATAAPGPATGGRTASFVLSSFNVLGSSHTRHGARGRAPGVVRIHGVARLLAQHDVDVAGFQELQQDQARTLLSTTGGGYALFPGPGRGKDSENSVGWRTSQWQLVQGTTLSVPYFNGHHRRMPVVLLRHRASGLRMWFGNFHNPAETHRFHHQQRWRTQATAIEAGLANRVARTGVPLFVTGDMNERAPYFCRLTAAAPSMVAARGGSNGAGGCQVGRPRAVDWIFGSRGVRFSGYGEDRGPLVDRTTDHPVITARAEVSASAFPRAAG